MGNEPKKTTPFLLGEISTEIKAVKDKVTVQNGAIDKLRESVNGLSERFHDLPCAIHAERIDNINNMAEREVVEKVERKRGRRELFIALTAALLTGGFTVLGVWLALAS